MRINQNAIYGLTLFLSSGLHMEKKEFLYLDVKAPKGINLIMFRDSSVTFSGIE